MITDIGLNYLFTTAVPLYSNGFANNSLISAISIGQGSTAPAVTDTALGNELAEIEGQDVVGRSWSFIANGGNFLTGQAEFDDATHGLDGTSITECGLKMHTTKTLLDRDLIRDSGGTPITISPLAGDTLTIEYEVSITRPASTSGSITIDGAAYDWYMDSMTPTTTALTQTTWTNSWITDIGTISANSYVDDSFEREHHVSFGVTESNDQTNGIQEINFSSRKTNDSEFDSNLVYARLRFELQSDPSKGLIRDIDQELVMNNIFKVSLSRA